MVCRPLIPMFEVHIQNITSFVKGELIGAGQRVMADIANKFKEVLGCFILHCKAPPFEQDKYRMEF